MVVMAVTLRIVAFPSETSQFEIKHALNIRSLLMGSTAISAQKLKFIQAKIAAVIVLILNSNLIVCTLI